LALGAPVGAAATSGPARGRRKRPRKAGAGVAGVGGHTTKEAGKLITQTSNEVEKGNEERGAVGVGAGVGRTDPRVVGARQTSGASDWETRRQHRCQEKKARFTGEEDTGATPKLRDAGAVRCARGQSGGHEQASIAVQDDHGSTHHCRTVRPVGLAKELSPRIKVEFDRINDRRDFDQLVDFGSIREVFRCRY